jgi:hypothetical protein
LTRTQASGAISSRPVPGDQDDAARPDGADARKSRTFTAELTTLLQIGSVVLILLLLLKAYGVARYSVVTGGELVTNAPLSIALGTLALYEPALFPIVSVALAWWLLERRRTASIHARVLAGFGCLVSAALAPVLYLVIAYAVAAIFYVLGAYLRHRTGAEAKEASSKPAGRMLSGFARNSLLYFIGLAVAVFVLATLETPWVPAEVVVTKSPILVNPKAGTRDSKPVVFVLSESSDYLFVLTSASRAVVRIPTSVIAGRIVCYQPGLGLGGRPLFDYLIGRTSTTAYLTCGQVRQELDTGQLTP